jgi:glycosyltransferase involved in cell wall biosynthesis
MESISIITVTYNDVIGLEKTIESVIKQKNNGANIEYIIVDGKSTDNTAAILEKYNTVLDIVVSEPDKGIFDAMNKGLKIATGYSVLFLNAGDIFYSDFNLYHFAQNYPLEENAVVTYTLQQYNEILYLRPSKKKKYFEASDFGHQGVFVPKKIYKNIFYDLRYSIIADALWMEKIWCMGNIIISDKISTVFSLGGISNTYSYNNLKRYFSQPIYINKKIIFIIKFIIFHLVGKKNAYKLLYSRKFDIFKIVSNPIKSDFN